MTNFARQLGRASGYVRDTRLGRAPPIATYTFLSLQKYRALLTRACADARKDAFD